MKCFGSARPWKTRPNKWTKHDSTGQASSSPPPMHRMPRDCTHLGCIECFGSASLWQTSGQDGCSCFGCIQCVRGARLYICGRQDKTRRVFLPRMHRMLRKCKTMEDNEVQDKVRAHYISRNRRDPRLRYPHMHGMLRESKTLQDKTRQITRKCSTVQDMQ